FLDDVSIKTNGLTNNNSVTAVSGVRGTAADLVAASSMSLTDADHADYTFTTAFSMGAWIYRDIDSGTSEGVFGKYALSGTESTFLFQITGADASQFITQNASDSLSASAGPTVALGQWYFWTGTYDGATQRFYINGVEVDSDAQTGNLKDSTESVGIGARVHGGTPSLFFDGKIDEAFLTAEVLSPTQIKHMYETGKRSLERKSLAAVTNATTVGNDRIGDTTSLLLE
ncbi:MAG: LamG domain-containing protein, partial [Anaerolineales bacterium]|nr:LamG domain-containing protein [Anaerolineales bacterium]